MAKKSDKDAKSTGGSTRITGPRGLKTVPGFKDRVGKGRTWWSFYDEVAYEIIEKKYNFSKAHPASVEYTTLFTRNLGKDHPLVEENLLTLLDPREEHISLRPTLDTSFVRAYHALHKNDFENGMPIEHWYTIGSVYGEKKDPREELQLYMTVLANDHPVVDAECTLAGFRYLEALGFKNIQVMVNSVGATQSQQNYKQELTAYYKEHKKDLPKDMQGFITKDPFKIYASTDDACKKLRQDAPQSVDWLVDDDKEHFIRVLEYLDELELPYMLSPELLPEGEALHQTIIALKVTTEEETEYILGRGGRFDALATQLMDTDFAAMKMVIDLDKCLTATRNAQLEVPQSRLPQVFLAQLGDAAKKKALAVREQLHDAGIVTIEHFGKDSLKDQLEQATQLGVKYTCLIGQKEILDGTILIRDMDGGIQEEVPIDKLLPELKKRLS